MDTFFCGAVLSNQPGMSGAALFEVTASMKPYLMTPLVNIQRPSFFVSLTVPTISIF